MSERRSWLESRHLARTPGGKAALDALGHLDAERRERILDLTDSIAELSATLAHTYFVTSVTAASELASDFDRWRDLADRILGPEKQGRNALECLLTLPPVELIAIDAETLDTLVDSVAKLATRSRRLAASFVETFAAQLCAHPTTPPARVDAWTAAIVQTLNAGQWRGEFLAGRLIETGAELFPALEPQSVSSWASLFVSVGSTGRSAHCPTAPTHVSVLDPSTQQRTLALTAKSAKRSAAQGEKLLAAIDRTFPILTTTAADTLLSALEAAEAEPDLADAVSLVPAIQHELGEAVTEHLCALVFEVAQSFPAGVPPMLRTMDRAYEEGDAEGIRLWAEHGARIGSENRDAGIAHFRLESRTSHKVLVQHSVAIRFEEVEPMLQRYLLMLARRPLQLVSGMGTWFRPPLSAGDDRLVRLSERVELGATAEDNQLFYKLSAAHAAGRWEFGTYDFRLTDDLRRGLEALDADAADDTLVGFLEAFPNPLLASVVFQLFDGARIDACLEREFRGLVPELDRLGRLYTTNPPPAAPERTGEALLEAFFLASVGRVAPDELPARLRAYGSMVEKILGRLRSINATVQEAAQLVLVCYSALALAAARGEDDGEGGIGVIDMGGATVIDPLDYSDDESAPPPNPYGGSPDGADRKLVVEGDIPEHDVELELSEAGEEPPPPGGTTITPEELARLIEQGIDLDIQEGHGEDQASLGLYITDLLGKLPAETIERLQKAIADGDSRSVRAWLAEERATDYHYYDEWDHRIGDYRRRWCRLTEDEIDGDGGAYFHRAMARSGDLVSSIKREFIMMRPDQFRKVRGMVDGEEFDLTALVDAHTDRRRRQSPSDRLYIARRREERDVATLFLVDMSASTDEPLPNASSDSDVRRVIDVTKDTLVIMATVLDEIGDAFAIYGFSGHGRENVEFFRAKSFNERLGPDVRTRLGGIEPKRSTRMGTALRHASNKLKAVNARAKHLILLSDGFPQDYDYGDDRTSNVYGIRDTMVALQELESTGVKTFCITVDPAGHDYLGDMCPASRYAVIDDISVLPQEMSHIYRTVTRT
jgi:hypothetical protein